MFLPWGADKGPREGKGFGKSPLPRSCFLSSSQGPYHWGREGEPGWTLGAWFLYPTTVLVGRGPALGSQGWADSSHSLATWPSRGDSEERSQHAGGYPSLAAGGQLRLGVGCIGEPVPQAGGCRAAGPAGWVAAPRARLGWGAQADRAACTPGLVAGFARPPLRRTGGLSLLRPICPLGEIEQTHKSQMTLIAEDGPQPRCTQGLSRPSR